MHRIQHANDGVSNSAVLVDADIVPTNGKVELPIILDNATLVSMLSAGKVDTTATLTTCVSTGAVNVHYELDGNVSLSVQKGI